jgi:cytochrome c oxidase subunit 4
LKTILRDRLTWVWAALSVVTVLSWWLARTAHDDGHFVASTPVTIAVLAIGFVKARFILQSFMEVRTSPTWLRRFCDIWLILFWGAVLGIYLYQ